MPIGERAKDGCLREAASERKLPSAVAYTEVFD